MLIRIYLTCHIGHCKVTSEISLSMQSFALVLTTKLKINKENTRKKTKKSEQMQNRQHSWTYTELNLHHKIVCKNCSFVCACDCVQLQNTIRHWIFTHPIWGTLRAKPILTSILLTTSSLTNWTSISYLMTASCYIYSVLSIFTIIIIIIIILLQWKCLRLLKSCILQAACLNDKQRCPTLVSVKITFVFFLKCLTLSYGV